MRQEEEGMRRYMKELERIEKIAESAYALSDTQLQLEQEQAKETGADARRKQLKQLTLDRRCASCIET